MSSCVAEKLENEEMMRREQRKVWVAKLRKQQNSCGVLGLPRWCLVVKNPPAKPRDLGDADSIPGLGRSPGGGHGNSFQYSRLGNPPDRRALHSTVHGVAELDTNGVA